MADASARELAQGRAHMDDWLEFLERMAEARAAVAAAAHHGPVGDRADPLHDRRHQRHRARRSASASATASSRRTRSTPGVLGPVFAARAPRRRGRRRRHRRRRRRRARRWPPSRPRSTPSTRAGPRVARPVDDRAPSCRSPGSRSWPTSTRRVLVVDGAQSAGAIRVDLEATGADAYAVAGPEVAARPGGDGRAGGPSAAASSACTPALGRPLQLRAARPGRHARSSIRPPAGSSGRDCHRPSVVGMARAISWLSMFVGLDWIHARGAATARAAADRLAAIPGVTVLTPTAPDGDPGHVPHRRLAGRGGARRARRAGRSRSPARSTASTRSGSASASSTPTRSSSASPRRSTLLAAPHARDHPAAPDPDHPRRRLR